MFFGSFRAAIAALPEQELKSTSKSATGSKRKDAEVADAAANLEDDAHEAPRVEGESSPDICGPGADGAAHGAEGVATVPFGPSNGPMLRADSDSDSSSEAPVSRATNRARTLQPI